MSNHAESKGVKRRDFLKVLGAGSAAVATALSPAMSRISKKSPVNGPGSAGPICGSGLALAACAGPPTTVLVSPTMPVRLALYAQVTAPAGPVMPLNASSNVAMSSRRSRI